MNPIDILEEVEMAPRGNGRIEALAKHDCPEIRTLMNFALSPAITFGVAQMPEPQISLVAGTPKQFHWQTEFVELATMLMTRSISGNAARDTIAQFLGRCSLLESKWSERIIKQDLRLNLNTKEINKALPGTIQTFDVPLATDYTKVNAKDLRGSWTIQPKLDGGRCVAILPGGHGRVSLLSRTGKRWKNFESIRRILQDYNDRRDGPDMYLDGEVVSYDPYGRIDFQQIQKTMMRNDGIEIGHLKYVIFDATSAEDWACPRIDYRLRLMLASTVVKEIHSPTITIIPTWLDRPQSPSIDFLREASERFVAEGYEGAIVRREDAPVENKRGKRLIKVKTFQDAEALVAGKVMGMGRMVDMLGALICQNPSTGTSFEIGSGFSDQQRIEIWKMKQLPRFVSYKFFEITDDGRPRFPIFRYFRAEEDIS